MTTPVILDAGPCLNFFGAGIESLLFAAINAISAELQMPAVVKHEVHGKAASDTRFAHAEHRLDVAIAARTVTIVDDEQDEEGTLAAIAEDIQLRLARLARRGDQPLTTKDLGEAMVLAHAVQLQRAGVHVRVILDEWRAQEVADQLRVPWMDSEIILFKAAKLGLIKNRGDMRKIWDRLRELDLGLVHWDQANRLHQKSGYGSEAATLTPSAAADSTTNERIG